MCLLILNDFLAAQGPPDLRKYIPNPPEGTPDLICPTLYPNPDCIRTFTAVFVNTAAAKKQKNIVLFIVFQFFEICTCCLSHVVFLSRASFSPLY